MHKSQGSEWDYVIYYHRTASSNSFFFNKRLIYTEGVIKREVCGLGNWGYNGNNTSSDPELKKQ